MAQLVGYHSVSQSVWLSSNGHLLKPWQTRTHCCRHKCFPVCPRAQHLLRTQILCPGHKNVSDFVQKHFVSATNVSQFAQPKKHRGQQCVRNNVSSFARALKPEKVPLSGEASPRRPLWGVSLPPSGLMAAGGGLSCLLRRPEQDHGLIKGALL